MSNTIYRTMKAIDLRWGTNVSFISSFDISPDGQKIVTGHETPLLIIWDVKTGNILHQVEHSHNEDSYLEIRSSKFLSNSQVISVPKSSMVLFGGGTKAQVWDINKGSVIRKLDVPNMANLSISSDFRRVIFFNFCQAAIWEKNKSSLDTLVPYMSSLKDRKRSYVYCSRFSACGNKGILGIDQIAKIWDFSEFRDFKLEGHDNAVVSVDFSPDGNTVVTGSKDQTAKIWFIKHGQRESLMTLKGHKGTVFWVRFFPDGKRILTASNDGSIRIWDTSSGKVISEITVLKYHDYINWKQPRDERFSVDLSLDGSTIITCCGKIQIWNAEKAENIHTLEHKRSFCYARFSSDRKCILAFNRVTRAIKGSKTDTIWGGNRFLGNLVLWKV